jgi:uncharacterized protein
MEFQLILSNPPERRYTSLGAGLRSDEVGGFGWDAGNSTKNLSNHGLTKETVESLFTAGPHVSADAGHSREEGRFVAVGLSAEGRRTIVTFTIRAGEGRNCIRPIGASCTRAREVKHCEKVTPGQGARR